MSVLDALTGNDEHDEDDSPRGGGKKEPQRLKRKRARQAAAKSRARAAGMHAVWSPRRYPRASMMALGAFLAIYREHAATSVPATIEKLGALGVTLPPETATAAINFLTLGGVL